MLPKYSLPLILLIFININLCEEIGFCDIHNGDCDIKNENVWSFGSKYIFYNVNPAEGFNLRRDVYMRFAIFTHNLRKQEKYKNIKLVLPPFNNLYHWKSREIGSQGKIPWNLFFDLASLQTFAPIIELNEVFSKETQVVFDRVYVLNNYENAFENGEFRDKWDITSDHCDIITNFWGYQNITFKNVECVLYQGSITMFEELINVHPLDKMILFTNAQIPLHEEYGSKKYWDARKSMKFNKQLISIAANFIETNLDCFKTNCDNFIGVHWRRGDFAEYRKKEVPSLSHTANQIQDTLTKEFKSLIKTVFIATDASSEEFEKLIALLESKTLIVKWFKPTSDIKQKYKDGGVAIIEQIICSHAAYFIGTHESTFSFRIQEEREIFGFDSRTTFNRLCPDYGPCEKPSRWKIVH